MFTRMYMHSTTQLKHHTLNLVETRCSASENYAIRARDLIQQTIILGFYVSYQNKADVGKSRAIFDVHRDSELASHDRIKPSMVG